MAFPSLREPSTNLDATPIQARKSVLRLLQVYDSKSAQCGSGRPAQLCRYRERLHREEAGGRIKPRRGSAGVRAALEI
jgi:hypothetical protein